MEQIPWKLLSQIFVLADGSCLLLSNYTKAKPIIPSLKRKKPAPLNKGFHMTANSGDKTADTWTKGSKSWGGSGAGTESKAGVCLSHTLQRSASRSKRREAGCTHTEAFLRLNRSAMTLSAQAQG